MIRIDKISALDLNTGYIRFTKQQRFEIDTNMSIIIAINSIVADRIMKLADMIKGSADEGRRAKYLIKRNYYRFNAKRTVVRLYEACKAYDAGLSRVVLYGADHNQERFNNNQMHTLDMMDFSDEYLKNDFLRLRSIIRKEAEKVADIEDLTMVGHIVEALAVAGMAKETFEHFTKITPVMGDITKFNFADGRLFWGAAQSACYNVDVKMTNKDKNAVFNILTGDRIVGAITDMYNKLLSLDFLNLLMEAREGKNPHFEQYLVEDALKNGYNDIVVFIDNDMEIAEPKNKMVI